MSTQFEKAESTFFNFEFPHNYFHLRRPLLEPPEGLFSEAELHARLVDALGQLPQDAVKSLREAWDQGREAFRNHFFELMGRTPGFFSMARLPAMWKLQAIRITASRRVSDFEPHWMKSVVPGIQAPASRR